MFFVTGDTHGQWERFDADHFPEGQNLTKDDYVFVMGDFGIWNNSTAEQQALDALAQLPFHICFVSGNHENYDILDSLPVAKWCGGKVNYIRDNVIHLRRGQVFELAGKKIFSFGGAASHDMEFRVERRNWWQHEMPNMNEMAEGIANLQKHDWKVDYIFTHCTTSTMQELVDQGRGIYQADNFTYYLEKLKEKVDYRWWVCGHYHMNYRMGDREVVLYEQIVSISD